MILSLFLFFLISLLILFSTIGYGIILSKILKFENFNYNVGIVGILGLFLLSVISSFTHLFLAHNYIHNILLIFIGIFGLSLLKKIILEESKIVIIIFSLLFISILISKTNEDFGYYHLPNSIQFAQQKLQFGIGNLNHGFKHISSLFMIMSLSYLPFFDHYLFNVTNFIFLVFFVLFILKEIFLIKNTNLNLSNFILSLILVLFLVKFSRLAEYGSDLAAQIITFLLFFYIVEYFFNEKIQAKKQNYLKISIILITFAITLKFISVIYIFLFFPFLILVNKKIDVIKSLLRFEFIIITTLSLLIFIFLNLSSTGCLIYPVEKLCFGSYFDWALSTDVVKYLNFHYEVWSKGGLGPGISVENQEQYIKNFNWVANWINVYFIGKFSDFLLVTLSIIIIFFCFFFKEIFVHRKKKYNNNINYLYFYISIIIVFLLWFFNFPTLRYAGYAVVYLIIILPFSLYASNRIDLSNKTNLKKISIIFLISYSIFMFKNISRLSNEFKLPVTSHHNFKSFPFYWVENKKFDKIKIDNHQLYLVKGKCWSVPSTCVRYSKGIHIIKKNNYIFYSKKK